MGIKQTMNFNDFSLILCAMIDAASNSTYDPIFESGLLKSSALINHSHCSGVARGITDSN